MIFVDSNCDCGNEVFLVCCFEGGPCSEAYQSRSHGFLLFVSCPFSGRRANLEECEGSSDLPVFVREQGIVQVEVVLQSAPKRLRFVWSSVICIRG